MEFTAQSLPRVDAPAKVTGKALYAADFSLPGCLVAQVLRSPLPHARILNVDASRAEKLPGVLAVITGKDLPGRRYGHRLKDMTVLARDRVRYVGEGVAAVAAIDADTAQEALDLIRVEYEELPAVFDPVQAMEAGSPVIHPELKTYEGFTGELEGPNICAHSVYGIGNIEEGFGQAEYVFEDTFRTPVVHQGYMEPHTCMVEVSGGRARVWSCCKSPFELRSMLALYLGVDISRIEVIYGSIGGDFGGKGLMMGEPLCYLLSLKSGRPVRLTYSLKEEFSATNPRHASIITIKTGLGKDGRITARQVKVIFNAGAYAGANSNITVTGERRSAGVYRIPHCRIDGYAVYTNTIPAGHCRAPGDPQAFFAVESHTDMLAHRLGIDPYEFRRRNCLREGDISPTGLKWRHIRALETLELAVKNSNWGTPKPSPRHGRGMAITERPVGFGTAAASVTVHRDGSVTVATGISDPGTGSRTVITQIVAQELQVPVARISLSEGNTRIPVYDQGSGNSRTTHVAGQAVRLAAREVLEKLRRVAAARLACQPEELSYQNATFFSPDGKELSLADLLPGLGNEGNLLTGTGIYSYPPGKNEETCFSAQVAEVEVDLHTGTVNVLKVVCANDIGLAINPQAAKGQVEGAVLQGMGLALNEELPIGGTQAGLETLADYKMPTSLEAPEIEVHLLEGAEGPGPYGAKSIGEQPISATAPAIANAIYDAVGVRITELPITPEKVYLAVREKETRAGRDGREI